MSHQSDIPGGRSSTLWRTLKFVGLIISVVILFQTFIAWQKAQTTPAEKAQKRLAEMQVKEADLPPELRSDPEDIAARVNASRPTPPPPSLPAANLEDIDFTQYSEARAEGVALVMGESRIESIDKIRLYFAPERGDDIINLRSQTFERDDGSVVLFAKSGIKDDSVKAQEIYAVFSGPGGDARFTQQLAAFGMRIKCHRGENTTEWQTDLCP